ncbi:hypothetical protein LJB42_002633 [Komagataella kurtzmanii]|nr:hypothetical protein LJB42_002633 [Komagataella kurtzmanii]
MTDLSFDIKFSESCLSHEGRPNSNSIITVDETAPAFELNFNSSILTSSAPSTERSQIINQEKTLHLQNGRRISLKRRENHALEIEDIVKNKSFDVGIKDIYQSMELQSMVEPTQQPKRSKRTSAELWAEKWRPRNFLEVAGNERTNRHLLNWLRKWSKAAHGEPLPSEEESVDPLQRPQKKILLIHGPPGAGKTTVAHIIAKQLGYEVAEINASDERAGPEVREKVHTVLTTQSFSKKPVCLIADEVDGSSEHGFIKVLLDIVSNDAKSTKSLHYSNLSKEKKARLRSKLLTRPIIAICNDVYTRSLDKLRAVSEIVAFRKSSTRSVKERLKLICDAEKIDISERNLNAIIDITDCDLRSSLNLLQFQGDQLQNILGDGDTKRKDSQLSWFSIALKLFKRNTKVEKKVQFKELSTLLDTSGVYERVANTCFNSLHSLTYQDAQFGRLAEIADWLWFYDCISNSIYEHQAQEMSRYGTLIPLKMFLNFSDANNTHETVNMKNNTNQYFEKKKAINEIVKSIHSNLESSLFSSLKRSDMASQTLPYVYHIILPNFKNMARLISLKPEEKIKLTEAAKVLKEFGFTIEQAKDETFTYIQKLVPPIDTVVNCQNDLSHQKSLCARANQILPYIEVELKRLNITKRHLTDSEQDFKKLQGTSKRRITGLTSPSNRQSRAASLQEGGQTRNQLGTSIDFFAKSLSRDGSSGRTTPAPQTNSQRGTTGRIWVRYNEGFSNAVRRNITWEELWNF